MVGGTLISADPSPSGGVSVCREIDGECWRTSIRQGDVASLDAAAPDLPAEARQALIDLWTTLPPPPEI